ncbi:NAD(P)-dependent oxidoreductase [Pseudahrensia aquimaris]|uniref:NAD(P)-dependent oxidoreductase n=1 Tax=Pseudahrensia aquimaris TaxID=744461 RepID=A0ABW3FHG7_9HYPH
MTKPTIGFIGLGLMGDAMVQRLQAKGYLLTVMANRSRTNVDAAITRGATEVKTAREIAESSDIIMLCMDTSASVEARMMGDDGVLAGLSKGKTVIDFGTSLPASTRMLGALAIEKGAGFMDAPLGRTPAHAIDGLLNIMGAGDPETFEKVKPVLEDLGENIFHLGPLGAGHTVKLINNFFGMAVATTMSEAFAMADTAGVERETLYNVMAAGPLRSGMMDFVKGYAVDGDPAQLAFAIKNARKDVGYYSTMADDAGVTSLMSVAPKQALGLAVAQGKGEAMVSEMVDFFAEMFAIAKK